MPGHCRAGHFVQSISSTAGRDQGVEDGGFLSVSPFAVTGEPEVGEVFFMFVPSVDRPLESVTPDCDWFRAEPFMCDLVLSLIFEVSLIFDVSFILELVLDPLVILVLELLLMPVLEPLIELVLSPAAGTTAPPAVAVSVVLALSLLLHAATATKAARIAMRFMKSSKEIIIVSAARHSARQCTRAPRCSGRNKRTPMAQMREGRNLCRLRPSPST